jgi:hypothetical protein
VTNVVPFGKYRGQPVELLAADRGYCDWLMGQAWFRDRYANVYTLIVNNFGEPAETPEHNALQARFLDQHLARALLAALQWQPVVDPMGYLRQTISYNEQQAKQYSGNRATLDAAKAVEAELAGGTAADEALGITATVEFEVGGWDVIITAVARWDQAQYVLIELKPSLGDDYPAVLRQMKANRSADYYRPNKVLVFDRFAASGATLDQVRAIFGASGFTMLSIDEIAAAAP